MVADFTEDSVALAIEMYLSVLSFPRLRFSIEPFSRKRERWLGADARMEHAVRGFLPFYLQFKRPSAYPDSSTSSIVKDRKNLISPTAASPHALFFELREKQSKHWDYQHNVLFRLRERVTPLGGDAVYVCPLFLNRSSYRFHVHTAALAHLIRFWRREPWLLDDVLINHASGLTAFNNVPVLAEHISIPPHAKVTSAKHRYSFNEAGKDVCFHSPEEVPDGSSKLSDMLGTLLRQADSDQGLISLRSASSKLKELLNGLAELGFASTGADYPFGGLSDWYAWGDFLRTNYSIEQYALVGWHSDHPFGLP
eukprot:gene27718-34482_t